MGSVDGETRKIQVWSTSVVSPKQAYEYWTDEICDNFVRITGNPIFREKFHGKIVYALIGGLDLSKLTSTAQHVYRTPRLIARESEGRLLGVIQTKGVGWIEQDGRTAMLRPGMMGFFDSTRPYNLHFEDDFEQTVVQFPLDEILNEAGLRDATRVTAVSLDSRGPAGIVTQFFHGLITANTIDPDGTATLAAHGRSLLGSLLALCHGKRPPERPATSLTRERVLAFIRSRHSDPALTVDDIARGCMVSRRTLYRLFEGEADGVRSLLRRVRVEHAKALLRTDPARTLNSIALACGFSGERQFYRVFRQETGLTPGEFRAGGTPNGLAE